VRVSRLGRSGDVWLAFSGGRSVGTRWLFSAASPGWVSWFFWWLLGHGSITAGVVFAFGYVCSLVGSSVDALY